MRYLPLDASEREAMLTRIGVPDVETLFADIPVEKRIEGLLDMPPAMSEMAVERVMAAMAARNLAAGAVPFFSGPAPISATSQRPSITSSSARNS